jgi:hypothetical protein
MKKTFLFILSALVLMTILTGCADAVHVEACINPSEHIYGFWGGVWHGMISWVSFIGSLFDSDIAVYAVNNNGAWYNFGYVGGLGLIIRVVALIFKSKNL